MIQLSFPHFELYVCFCRVYGAKQDNWFKKGVHIRIGSYAYSLKRGWRNWRKEA